MLISCRLLERQDGDWPRGSRGAQGRTGWQIRSDQRHVGEVVEEETPELLDLSDSKSVESRYERRVEGQMVGEAGM